MPTDDVSISLGLPGLAVLGVEDGDPIRVRARFREEATCPCCLRPTWQVHQWHRQVKRDLTACGRPVEIVLRKRRFRCRRCHKVFTEPDPVCGARRRSSRRWRQHLGRRARYSTVRAVVIDLAEGWVLKEELRALYRCSAPEAAARSPDCWLLAARRSRLPAFRRVAGTLEKWREEVLNNWRFPFTNAFVEGKHNRVKVLKRRAYGYRNDAVFRQRILNLVHTN